jgi:hypothetical protein
MSTRHWTRTLAALAVVGATGAAASNARAGLHTLVDGNSSASFDTGSQSGMYDWFVDGVDHIYQQWFWYRTNAMQHELSVDTLPIHVEGTTDTDFDGDPDTLFVRYRVLGLFDIELRFTLHGGLAGSQTADIAEQIAIHNTGRESLAMSFFQYNDADLNGGSTDSGVSIYNTPAGSAARQSDTGTALHETVVTPLPTHYEAAGYPQTLLSLNDTSITVLNDNPGLTGLGDYTWAFQWDFVIGPGGSFIISKDKQIAALPVPGAAVLGALGLAVAGWMKRRIA